ACSRSVSLCRSSFKRPQRLRSDNPNRTVGDYRDGGGGVYQGCATSLPPPRTESGLRGNPTRPSSAEAVARIRTGETEAREPVPLSPPLRWLRTRRHRAPAGPLGRLGSYFEAHPPAKHSALLAAASAAVSLCRSTAEPGRPRRRQSMQHGFNRCVPLDVAPARVENPCYLKTDGLRRVAPAGIGPPGSRHETNRLSTK